MKLQVADDAVLYPDLFVACDKGDLATEQVFCAPMLVIEVPADPRGGDTRHRGRSHRAAPAEKGKAA